jgi:hypothetical protein
MGWAVGSIQSYYPEKEKLKWAQAKIAAMQLDLDRWSRKNQEWAKEMVQKSNSPQELPQQNLSYWKFEGPKLQQRVLDLEMELDLLRSKTVWKQD